MRIDAWAEKDTHYLDHLSAVWRALPDQRRGTLWVGPALRTHAFRLQLEVRVVRQPPPTHVPILRDSRAPHGGRAPGRPIALIEHGVGQPYLDVDHCAHPGGRNRDRIGLYLCPNRSVADRNHAAYPDADVALVGAPHLDPWHRRMAFMRAADSASDISTKILTGDVTSNLVVVSWHFAAAVCPEAGTAWPHYGPAALVQLAATFGDRLRGHAHPRLLPQIRHFYDDAGIEVLDWFPDVLDQAAIYACDNSSTIPEFAAATGRPVVFMSAPWYRRDVHHGGRFWEWPRDQVHVEEPEDLVAGIERAREDTPLAAAARARMASEAYAFQDGHCAERAATAVVDWL